MADRELPPSQDKATRFSLTYLDILEKRLDFMKTEDGAPFSHPYSVNVFSLQRLKLEMDELFADPMFVGRHQREHRVRRRGTAMSRLRRSALSKTFSNA